MVRTRKPQKPLPKEDKTKPGIIFELKRVIGITKTKFKKMDEDEIYELLEKEAKEALGQIKKNHYQSELTKHGIRHAVHVGVSFLGKYVSVVYENKNYS